MDLTNVKKNLDPRNKYYVYLYYNEAGTPYYVGKGTGSRCTDEHGSIPVPPDHMIIKVLENVDEETALKKEKQLIELHRREVDGGTLLNTVVPTGNSGRRPGAFNACFEPTLLQAYKDLCWSQNLKYTKVLERFAEHYVAMNGNVNFPVRPREKLREISMIETILERLDRLELKLNDEDVPTTDHQ